MKNIKILMVMLVISTVMILSSCAYRSGEQKDKAIKLRIVTCDAGFMLLDAKEIIKAANDYSEKTIGVTVDLEFQPSDKINLMMASGEYYDIVFTSSWLNKFDNNASAGMFYDISDKVASVTPALYESVGEYWDSATLNGRIYGMPILKDMGTENMFRLNADYFEGEKGMTIPESMKFSDIEPYLAAYKEDYPDKYPFAMDKGGLTGVYNSIERVVSPIIVIPYDREGEFPRAIPLWEDEGIIEQFRLLHKWYKAGYIHPDAATIDSTSTDKSIPVRVGVAWRGYQGYSNPDDWGFHVKTSIYQGPYISRTSEQGAMFGICAACDEEHVDASLRYIELLSTDRKFRDILAYGIEGKHFEYLPNKTVLRLKTGQDRYYTRLYQTGSVVNASVESASRDFLADPDQWKKVFEGYKLYGIRSRTNGFAYDQSDKENLISSLIAIYKDYETELNTGTSDPDEIIPVLDERMRRAGIDELLEDVQTKLNDWVKNEE
ncbi:ABC transporter substrate-binding protein [Lachnospiraceae bacterium C1.1]|nr:ABC transporter substrate-binding protein [Lachnospiraceae bacterium C1.1]